MEHILLIEDDENIAQIVKYHLQKEGYEVAWAADGKEGLDRFAEQPPALVILDIMLPGMDGLQVLENIRKTSDIPVIITSARMTEQDRLQGLERMADDYIVKPFSVKELLARVRVHLARYRHTMVAGQTIKVGTITVDLENKRVLREGTPITLSKNEYDLLCFLLMHRGEYCSREELLRQVWGYETQAAGTRIVDVAVRRLREKIEQDPARPEILRTSRGKGYYCV